MQKTIGNILSRFPAVKKTLVGWHKHYSDLKTVLLHEIDRLKNSDDVRSTRNFYKSLSAEDFRFSKSDFSLVYTSLETATPENASEFHAENYESRNYISYPMFEGEHVQNFCTTAQHALIVLNEFENDKDPSQLIIFKSISNALLTESVNKQGLRFYPYNFDYAAFGLKAPWLSCIAQAQVGSVFLRAFQLTGEENYLTAAAETIAVCWLPKSSGGLEIDSKYGPWSEEYPSPQPTLIINGFCYVLIAMMELYHFRPDEKLRKKIEQYTESYIKALPYYHAYGTQVRYMGKLSSWYVNQNYFNIQTLQHKHLYLLSGMEGFRKIYEYWKQFATTGKTLQKQQAIA